MRVHCEVRRKNDNVQQIQMDSVFPTHDCCVQTDDLEDSEFTRAERREDPPEKGAL